MVGPLPRRRGRVKAAQRAPRRGCLEAAVAAWPSLKREKRSTLRPTSAAARQVPAAAERLGEGDGHTSPAQRTRSHIAP